MRSRFKDSFILLLIVAFSLHSVWPVVMAPHNSFVFGGEDILITWILNQTINKIPFNLDAIFQGNIFYPYKNTMAYSVLLIPSALISFLPVKLTGYPILAYSTSLIVGQILTITVCYLWFRDMTGNKFSSLLGAVALGLSQIRIHYFAHLQMWTMQWWLFAAWMVWKFKRDKKIKYLYIAGLFSVISFWENILPFLFLLTTTGFLLCKESNLLKENWRHIVLIIILFLLVTSPVIFVYFDVSKQFDYVRPIREVAHFSMSLEKPIDGYLFSPGLFSLIIVSILMLTKKILKKSKDVKWLAATAIFSFIMALGPVLKFHGKTVKILGKYFIPLPYGVFYYLVPGLKAFRTPSRWIWLFAFGLSGIIAVAFGSYKSRFKNVFILAGILLAFVGGSRINNVIPALLPSQYPKVYEWLANQRGEVILELPIYTWGAGEIYHQEMFRMLYSLSHEKKLVNGASGFYPPAWEKLAHRLGSDFPSGDIESELADLGVDYIVVHRGEYDAQRLIRIESWGKNKLIWSDEETVVYKI